MYLTACRECDLLALAQQQVHATFRCPRCHALLHHAMPEGLDHALALCAAAIILFSMATSFPVIAIEAAGNKTQTTLLGTALALQAGQMKLVAILVFVTTLAVPVVELSSTFLLLWLSRFTHHTGSIQRLFRLRQWLKPWNMVEIFVLGTLVAITRLGSLATVIIGAGFWSLIGFMILNAASHHAFDSLSLWDEIEQRRSPGAT